MKATLKSIAQATGVSAATVSLVLNHKPCRVSEATKELIESTAREMNYIPNQAAVSLKCQKTKTFGFLVPDISNSFYSDLAKLVEENSSQRGYNIFLGNSNGLYQRDYEYLNLFITRGVDAVIMIPSSTFREEYADAFFQIIRAHNVPVIVLDHYMESDVIYNLTIDHELGSYEATKHLLSLGHTRIGCCTGPLNLLIGRQRLAGYKKALAEFQIPYNEELVFTGDFLIESGAPAVAYFTSKRVSAICCSNDMMALGVYRECMHFQIRIPEDISVIGFDNIGLSSFLNPPLTTVALPMKEIAEAAVDMAIKLSNEEADIPRQRIFAPSLMLRKSTLYRKPQEGRNFS